MKTEFLEDDEEWVWKNALRVQDKVRLLLDTRRPFSNWNIKVYHATCHASAVSNLNPLTARLRNESVRSRSGTPDLTSTPPSGGSMSSIASTLRTVTTPASPRAEARGLKRKADNDHHEVLVKEEEGTPPLKRVAI